MKRPKNRLGILSGARDGDAAWGAATNSEPRWPASLAVLAALALYVALPVRLTLPFGPDSLRPFERWIMPALEMVLLVPLTVAAPRRHHHEPRWARRGAIVLIAVVNLANVISLGLLVDSLLNGSTASGKDLVLAAINIWLTNVLVFALWYWELDRGGPDERSSPRHRRPDFLFPQMVTPDCADDAWTPGFLDYVYLAFTNATAFSPTDTMPLTPLAKMLMLVQSAASLLTVAVVAGRAVNILS